MSITTAYLLVYSLSFIAGLGFVTLLSSMAIFQRIFFRVAGGGIAGGFTSWYLAGVAPFVSWVQLCMENKLGIGGYVYVASLVALISVWGYNLRMHDGVIVK